MKSYLRDIQKPLVCFGVSFDSEIPILVSFSDDEFRNPVRRVCQILIFNGDSEDKFVLFIFVDSDFVLKETTTLDFRTHAGFTLCTVMTKALYKMHKTRGRHCKTCSFCSLTDVFVKVGGLSLTSNRVTVAVPVLERPFCVPSKSLICMTTMYLSFTLKKKKKNVRK